MKRSLFILIFIVLILSGVAHAAENKENLVLMPLRGTGIDKEMLGSMESAVVDGLSQKYEVFSGERVAKKVREVYEKESKYSKKECDETKCVQDIAFGFNSELIANVMVLKRESGYVLTLNIKNVVDDKAIFSKSLPCEGCSEFKVIDQLRIMAGGQSSPKSGVGLEPAPTSDGMVFVKGGCYQMGDTFGDGGADEKPVHEVCVNDFYLGKYEVTQKEWKKIMGSNPSNFKDCGDNCPVETVSWNDVQEYIKKLNQSTGKKLRLPTEAEWEYAARSGGKKVRFGTGKDTTDPDEANFDASSAYKQSYSSVGTYRRKTIPVGSFKSNSLGLYDMTGNVWEWVNDWYADGYYKNSPKDNPQGPDSGSFRVLRGGSWTSSPENSRAANRYDFLVPVERNGNSGFRLAQDN